MREIARRLGRPASTVSRELVRNGCAASARRPRAYRACARRRELCRRRGRLVDPALHDLVTSLVVGRRWPPEQVAGRIALERGAAAVSTSTIRRAIRRGELDIPELRRRRSGDRRGDIPAPYELAERPPEAAVCSVK